MANAWPGAFWLAFSSVPKAGCGLTASRESFNYKRGNTRPDPPPPPPCENNAKVPKCDGNNTWCCSHKGVVCARREKTQAVNKAKHH